MVNTVVVGVEGTESSQDALVWAAEFAGARKSELEILCATGTSHSHADALRDEASEQAAKELVHEAAERAVQVSPRLAVHTTVSASRPGEALTEASVRAELMVVGSHRLGARERAFSGPLAYQIVAGSRCPALVVPAGTGDGGSGVVVGTDGSPESGAGVALAAAEADRFGQELTVVHAWQTPLRFVSVDIITEHDNAWIEENRRTVLADSVVGLAERYPNLVIHQSLVNASPGRALLEAAVGARMLVVGSRGLNGIARMLLGSVSHAMVLHSPCPVMVVHT